MTHPRSRLAEKGLRHPTRFKERPARSATDKISLPPELRFHKRLAGFLRFRGCGIPSVRVQRVGLGGSHCTLSKNSGQVANETDDDIDRTGAVSAQE